MIDKKRLLLADPSSHTLETVTNASKASDYNLIIATSGPDCLSKLSKDHPDLLIIDLMLPHIHGIEILKKVRQDESMHHIGVIILSYNLMFQNYHAAIESGANFFLIKPFDPEYLFTLVKRFFEENLHPTPFTSIKPSIPAQDSECYNPTHQMYKSYLRFWGTRGSNAVSGANYMRYGGNTCCLELRVENVCIVIDAGTGIRQLGELIVSEELSPIHLFIGHTHWDHITGFPFFAPLYQKNCEMIIWAPVGFEKNTKDLFTDMLAYSYFPVRLDEMRSKITFKELRDRKALNIGKITVESHFTNHPGPTCCFKFTMPGKTIGYVTDNELLLGYLGHPKNIGIDHPLLEPHISLIKFLKGCDTIIHEAQYFPNEYLSKIGWGHSSISNATVLIKHTGCQHWIVTHHAPQHTDAMLQKKLQMHKTILEDCEIDATVTMAYDNLLIPL